MNKTHNGIWIAYILSFFTPVTFLLSGVIAIIYAGYRLDKGQDSELVNSHYYGIIRTFFLFLTFFVVLAVSIATSNGVLIGIHDYWMHSSKIEKIAYAIPWIGAVIAVLAIFVWFLRLFQGILQLKRNLPYQPSTGPNL